jgi:hypothetical protein
MGTRTILRLGAAAILLLGLSSAPQAQDDDEGYDNGYDNGREARRSTWELNTSLTFRHYIEPFRRVPSARACRDRCVSKPRCTGWTYYDANFYGAGEQSYQLQQVCVLGAGLKDRKPGNRPGRISGVIRPAGQEECCAQGNGNNGDYRPRRDDYRYQRGEN